MIRILILLMIWCSFAKPAYAYIDAAIGSLILQSLVAGFFSFMVIWRGWVEKVKSFFRKKSDETPVEDISPAGPAE